MSQISLFSGLSATTNLSTNLSANLNANLGLNLKAPVLAAVHLKGLVSQQATSHVETKAQVKAEVKAPAQDKAPAPVKEMASTSAHQETIKAHADVKAQAEVKLKEIVTAPIKAEVKAEEKAMLGAKEAMKSPAIGIDFHKDIKLDGQHKACDTIELSKLKFNLEGHAQLQSHAHQMAHHHDDAHQACAPATANHWQAHGDAHIELTGHVQCHDAVMHG